MALGPIGPTGPIDPFRRHPTGVPRVDMKPNKSNLPQWQMYVDRLANPFWSRCLWPCVMQEKVDAKWFQEPAFTGPRVHKHFSVEAVPTCVSPWPQWVQNKARMCEQHMGTSDCYEFDDHYDCYDY